LLIKHIKIVLWRVAKRLSYTEDVRCLKVKWSKHHCRILYPRSVYEAEIDCVANYGAKLSYISGVVKV